MTSALHPKADFRARTKKGGANGRPSIPTFTGVANLAARVQRAGKRVT